jgi:hypothetical protein
MSAALELSMDAAEARAITDQIKVGVEAVWHLITRAYTERAWMALGYTSWDDYCTREFGTSRLRLPREERSEVVSSLRESGLSLRAIQAATGLGKSTVQREISGVPFGTPEGRAESTAEIVSTLADGDADLADSLTESLISAGTHSVPCRDCDGYGCETCFPEDPASEAQPEPAPKPITGIDGKTYKPQTAAPKEQRRKPITDTARELGLDIAAITNRVEKLGADDRLVGKKNEVAPKIRHHLEQLIKVCQDLNQQLTTGV